MLAFSEAIANLRNDLIAYENGDIDAQSASEEDIEKHFSASDGGSDIDQVKAKMEMTDFGETASLYVALKEYEGGSFKKGELLDFFKRDDIDAEELYPMAAALSDGQKAGLSFVSLNELLRYSFIDDEAWKKGFDNTESSIAQISEMSVYDGVDRDVFKDDGSVAMTDEAMRSENAKSLEESKESKWSAIASASAISWVCTAVSLASFIGFSKLASYFDQFKGMNIYVRTEKILLPEDQWKVIFTDPETGEQLIVTQTLEDIYKTDPGAVYTKYIANFFKFATIVLAVASAVMTVIALLKTDDTEQLPIPEYMVDSKSQGDEPDLVTYKAVQCNREEYFGSDYKKQKGNCADLLCDEGKQWLALYAAKDKINGYPLTTDIIVQKSKDAPQGYEDEISIIGELGAVNLASKAFRNYSSFSQVWQNIISDYSVYVFYKTDPYAFPAGEPVDDAAEAESNGKASNFSPGTASIFGCIGLGNR